MRNCLIDDDDVDGTAHSLRDTDNYPHLTIVHDPLTGATHSEAAKMPGTTLTARVAAGAHGPVKPEYQDLVREWLDTLPYNAALIIDRAPILPATDGTETEDPILGLAALLEELPHSDVLVDSITSYHHFLETYAARNG